MSLKDSNLIMIPDLDLPPTGEYPYLVNFDEPPYTERVKAITTLDGDISEVYTSFPQTLGYPYMSMSMSTISFLWP
jgi:hypothetical protein